MRSLVRYFNVACAWPGNLVRNFRLIVAAQNGDTEHVKTLLAKGAHVHAWDDEALKVAAVGGHSETARALLEAGADAHARKDEVLWWAERNGDAETVRVLKDWMERVPQKPRRQPGMS